MSAQDRLQAERIRWLTKAVRALLKVEFDGQEGSRDYATMEVGKQDAVLSAREAQRDAVEKDFKDFLNDPDEASARAKLDEFLRKKGGTP